MNAVEAYIRLPIALLTDALVRLDDMHPDERRAAIADVIVVLHEADRPVRVGGDLPEGQGSATLGDLVR